MHGLWLWLLLHRNGGYAVGIAQAPQILFPSNRSLLTFTASDLRLLAKKEPDYFPDPSKEEIIDKSKADGLTETTICFQALWFCV